MKKIKKLSLVIVLILVANIKVFAEGGRCVRRAIRAD